MAPGGMVGSRCPFAGSSSLSSVHSCLSFKLGAHLDWTASRVWSQEESLLHINVLEMRAVLLVMATFLPQLASKIIVLMSDNATVVAYLKDQGDTVSRVMCDMAREVIQWSKLHSVTLLALYIASKKNVLADQLSCSDQVVPTEWYFLPRVLKGICEVFGHPHLDLLATRANTKLSPYVSPVSDPMVWRQDVFQHLWDSHTALAFPPFALIWQVLSRVRFRQGSPWSWWLSAGLRQILCLCWSTNLSSFRRCGICWFSPTGRVSLWPRNPLPSCLEVI